jgi:hypothetical protein
MLKIPTNRDRHRALPNRGDPFAGDKWQQMKRREIGGRL